MIYSINEGQQAEEYKARKAKEAEDKKTSEDDRWKTRYAGDKGEFVGRKFGANNPNSKDIRKRNREYWNNVSDINAPDNTKEYEKTINDDYKRHDASWRASNKMVRTGKIPPFNPDEKVIADTKNRHMRRHPKQYKEGTIFESVELI